jgi:hypothetical protein
MFGWWDSNPQSRPYKDRAFTDIGHTRGARSLLGYSSFESFKFGMHLFNILLLFHHSHHEVFHPLPVRFHIFLQFISVNHDIFFHKCGRVHEQCAESFHDHTRRIFQYLDYLSRQSVEKRIRTSHSLINSQVPPPRWAPRPECTTRDLNPRYELGRLGCYAKLHYPRELLPEGLEPSFRDIARVFTVFAL